MNNYIIITARAELTTPNKKKFKHKVGFEVYEVPPEYTEKILNSENPLAEYKKWVKKNIEPFMRYGAQVDLAKEHIEKLNKFVRKWKNLGFDIVVSSKSIDDYKSDVYI
jgi:hypothetical protein